MKFQENKINLLWGIWKKFYSEKWSRKKIVSMDYSKFLSLLNFEEKKLIKKIQNLDISKYCKKTPFYGIRPAPKDLVMIRNRKIHTSFLPEKVYQAFKKMNAVMKKEIRGKLVVRSGYRSPAYQMLIFIYHLKNKNWSIKKTLRGAALPGYSEHGCPRKQAIDFTTAGILEKKEKDFSQTKEYQWLKRNAARFGFYLSFPQNNKLGVKFEPWHWRYEAVKKNRKK